MWATQSKGKSCLVQHFGPSYNTTSNCETFFFKIWSWYPLVNEHNYGKIHHFQWVNPLFLWPFSMSQTVNVITRPGTFKVLEAPEKGPQISTIGFQETLQQFSRHLTPGVEIGCPCYIPRGRTPPGAYMLWMAAVRGDREFWMNDQSMLHTQVASLAYIMYIYIHWHVQLYTYVSITCQPTSLFSVQKNPGS